MTTLLRDKRAAKDDPTIADRLRAHRTLADAPQAELDWLIERGTLGRWLPGDVVVTKGSPINELFFVLEGRLSALAGVGGAQRKVMDWRAGDATGMYPYSRITVSSTESSVDEPSEVLSIDRADVNEMPVACPHVTAALVHLMIDRARTFKANDLEGEKVASLGRVAAGLAHELNNPASAATRGAKLLEDAIAEIEDAARALGAVHVTDSERAAVERVRAICVEKSNAPDLSPLEHADREDTIAEWLASHDIDERGASTLAGTAVTIEMLDELAAALSRGTLRAAVHFVVAGCHVRSLARDVERASSRVHDLVSSVKRVAYMDRAISPEAVDLRQGLSDTSAILAHKARAKSAALTVDAPENLARAFGIGGELSQVWMNLIDNALDAVGNGGRVSVVARREGPSVIVRVIDDGPGIPDDIKRRIFDPFFTTKPVGQGVGMGLDIARRLVESNNGRLDFESTVGKTEFRVALPIA
jgi:signal transduction histidine kinase